MTHRLFHSVVFRLGIAISVGLGATPRAHGQMLEAAAETPPPAPNMSAYDTAVPDPMRDPFSTLVLVRPDIHDQGMHVVQLSAAASGGYDTATDSVAGAKGYMVEGEGHAAISHLGRRYDLLLEHDAKGYRSFVPGYGFEQFQHTTAWLSGAHSVRTDWAVMAENSFGSEDAQLAGSLTDLSSVVVVPTATTAILAYEQGNALYDHVEGNLQHLLSRRDTLSFDASAMFRRFFSINENDSQYDAGVSLRRQMTQELVTGVRLDAVHQTYSQLQCTTGALSLFTSADLSRTMRATASAGVLNGTSQCQGTYVFDSLFQYMRHPGSLMFVGATRRNSDSYVQNTAWQTSVFGGVRAGRVSKLLTRLDAGWTSYQSAPVIGGPNISGVYASGEIRRRVLSHQEIAFTARYFDTANGDTRNNRALLFLTYSWSRATPEEREEKLGYGK